MGIRLIRQPWTQQPQEAVRPAPQYADMYAAFVGGQTALIGSAGGEWTRVGSPQTVATQQGLGSRATSYSATDSRHIGPALDGGTLDWPGVTVVAVVSMLDMPTDQYPNAVSAMPVGEYYGVFNLSIENIGTRIVIWRAGNSVNQVRLPGGGDQWSPGDELILVARWDKATLNLAGLRNGVAVRNSAASSAGWRTGSNMVSVGGYTRSGYRMLTSPIALAAIIPRDVGEGGADALLENPWALFEPQRIWVPVSAGGGGSWSVSLTESASASDSLAAATTALVSLIESASAADIITAATIAAVALTEAASASDTQTASYSVTGSGSVTESASASDTLDAATTMLRALTETASADDQLAAATTMLRAISESASAVDTPAASYSGAGTATIEELTSATDALTAAATLLVTILEAGNADDALQAATTMVRAITEQAMAIDTVAGALPGSTWDVSIEELAAAVDLITGYAAGGLTVSPLGLRLSADGRSARLSTTARMPRLSTRTR